MRKDLVLNLLISLTGLISVVMAHYLIFPIFAVILLVTIRMKKQKNCLNKLLLILIDLLILMSIFCIEKFLNHQYNTVIDSFGVGQPLNALFFY